MRIARLTLALSILWLMVNITPGVLGAQEPQPAESSRFSDREPSKLTRSDLERVQKLIPGRQLIENAWTIGFPPGSTWPSEYYDSPLCDEKPEDSDWTFLYYPMEYSQNPDGLRWTTTSSQVYAAFMGSYAVNLGGYSFGWNEVRLCIGTTGVSLAGGPDNVKNTTFLHPNN